MSLRVFYVDDEPQVCRIFADIYGKIPGIQLRTFTEPEEALAAMEREAPDLVFLDYRFPKTNGAEIAKRIPEGISIVLVSGDLDIKLKPPFIMFFPKPFEFVEIREFLEQRLQSSQRP